MSLFLPIFIGIVILSTIGVALVRALAGKKGRLQDNPNERSLHSGPKPRGGGVVIALLVVIALSLHLSTDGLNAMSDGLILTSLLMIATVGFLDDIFSLPALPRLVVHLVASLLFCLALPMFSVGRILDGGEESLLSAISLTIAVAWISWSTNAFNFMDGSDGLAALQAVVGGLGIVGIGLMLNDPLMTWIGGTTAAATLGFLFHNWSPAKIFLGDVGSSFIGFLFGTIPILVLNHSEASSIALSPLIALGVAWPFYFDSGTTLLRRLLTRQRVWQPHREHAYQRIILLGNSHSSVAMAYGLLAAIPILFILVGLHFKSVFYLSAAFGLILSTVGMFVYNKYAMPGVTSTNS